MRTPSARGRISIEKPLSKRSRREKEIHRLAVWLHDQVAADVLSRIGCTLIAWTELERGHKLAYLNIAKRLITRTPLRLLAAVEDPSRRSPRQMKLLARELRPGKKLGVYRPAAEAMASALLHHTPGYLLEAIEAKGGAA